jgi:hypothetical protein
MPLQVLKTIVSKPVGLERSEPWLLLLVMVFSLVSAVLEYATRYVAENGRKK